MQPGDRNLRPTPAEIAIRSAEIRARWDKATEYLRRTGLKYEPFELEVVSLHDLLDRLEILGENEDDP